MLTWNITKQPDEEFAFFEVADLLFMIHKKENKLYHAPTGTYFQRESSRSWKATKRDFIKEIEDALMTEPSKVKDLKKRLSRNSTINKDLIPF